MKLDKADYVQVFQENLHTGEYIINSRANEIHMMISKAWQEHWNLHYPIIIM
jgi:hypothetical protein